MAYQISGLLILVADADPDSRSSVCRFLQERGFAVCEAENPKAAIDMFDRHSPKMVLLDAAMPTVDGFDALMACRRIREIDRDEYSPVLMIAAEDDCDLINAAFEAGAADYVCKPLQWTVLEHRIRYKLRSSRMAYELEASEARFRQLFDDSPLPYQSLDDHGRVIDANKAWLAMMELEASGLIGKPFGEFMSKSEWRKFMAIFPSFIRNGVVSHLHLQVTTGRGRTLDVEMNGRVACDSQGQFKQMHIILQNITERKAMEDELRRLASSDPLTGLANRRAFFAEADRMRLQCVRFSHPYTVLMLDIDHFKSINDNYGHDVGDDVLKAVASEMKRYLRNVDLLGRLGGEEFAIALPETALNGALTVAERLRSAIAQFVVDSEQGTVRFTISIGVASLTDAGEENDQLLKRADTLLYRAKQQGRNRVEHAPD